ncbi:MAG: chloride channel protein [Acetobacterales bacterium]
MLTRQSLSLRSLVFVRRFLRNDLLVLAAVAVVIGGVAGCGAIALREAIVLTQYLFYGDGSERLLSLAIYLPWWHVLLAPAAGGLLVGLFLQYVMPGQRPRSVADVVAASAVQGSHIPLRVGIAAAIVNAFSIGVGASVGREGPAVHLGAALASKVGHLLHFSRRLARTTLACGAAAAVAASFNAPIAGALFAHEVIVGHYALSAFAPVVIASVTGTVVSRIYFGDFPAFILPPYEMGSFWEFPAFALLGVVAGLVAIVFMRSIIFVCDTVEATKTPLWLRPAVAGLAVGAMALMFPHVLGVGYQATDAALHGRYDLLLLVGLAVAKVAATAISLGSGFGGGVFSPSLFIGAMVGGAFGVVATALNPELSSGHNAYALIGMGAVAGAVLGAPISTTLIIFEMTADYTLTIALMLSVVLASVIVQQVQGRSFFLWQLERRGLNLGGGRDAGLLEAIRVGAVMRNDCAIVPIDLSLQGVRLKLQGTRYGELFVVDGDGRLYGTVTLADLSDAAFDHSYDDMVNAADLARRRPPVLHADDGLDKALALMESLGEEHVAVVAANSTMKMIGCLHEHDVMMAYNRALARLRREERSGI